ncbi:MAG TPA: serine hydrolase domain-containing protein [Opitutaceae bacterium]|nr:serine hydrolase domain-containing protein [Opitutaceae bacterium]
MTAFIWRRFAAGALLGFVATAQGHAVAAQPALQSCVAAQAERMDFSGAVSIVAPWGSATYARGVQGGSGSTPISPHTRFNLGSAGKMFTAVAVMQLVDAGKVGLNDPVGRYVEGLTPEAAAVTVRQLLTHSSGLGDFFTPQNLPSIAQARSVSDLMALVRSDTPAFRPGSRFQYSNSGFLILGRLVERLSSESYGTYLQRRVFAPAGMSATGMDPGAGATRAVGMTAMDGGPPGSPAGGAPRRVLKAGPDLPSAPGPLHPSVEAALRGNPAGGSYSTVEDMQRFFRALEAGRLVSLPTLQRLTSTQIVAAPAQGGRPELDYALGFGVGVTEGHRWYGHNGGAPGVTVEATAYPDDHTVMVVMSNRDPPSASLLFRQLRPAIFAHDPEKACTPKDQSERPDRRP